MLKFMFFLIFIFLNFANISICYAEHKKEHKTEVVAQDESSDDQSEGDVQPKDLWIGGWYDWNPYQYLKSRDDPTSLTGLDVAFSKLILKKLRKRYEIPAVSWRDHQEGIKSGEKQFAMGAFLNPEREKYAYLTKPYREEQNSLFVLKENAHLHTYENVDGFLDFLKKSKIKIGVVDGYKFGNEKINEYVNDPANDEFIVKSKTDVENMDKTVSGVVDGFLSDRIVGATILWKEGITGKFNEIYFGVTAPIRMMLSKASVTAKESQEVNNYIDEIKTSEEYIKLINWYFYPIILMQTADTYWFFVLEICGLMAFAISGLILAARINSTLLGAFLLSFVPAVGGGVIRDVIFGRYPIWIVQNKAYMIMILYIVIIGFVFSKLQQKFFNGSTQKLHEISDHIIVVTDAIGLSVFTVTGVIVSMLVKTDPLWFWGPFFALITGAGGGMLRDLIVKTKNVDIVYGEIYGELAIIWGGILSVYLTLTVDDTRPERIINSVVFCVTGCFITRLILHYYKVKNVPFGAEKQIKEDDEEDEDYVF